MEKIYEFKKQLRGEYLESFENAELYYKLNNIAESVTEGCLNEIGDLLINAQKTERPVEKVLGKNLERFCKNLRNAYAPYWHIEKIVNAIFLCVSFTLGVGLYNYISSMLFTRDLADNLGPTLLTFFISKLVVNSILYIVRTVHFSKHKLHSKTVILISKSYYFLFILFAFIIEDLITVTFFQLTLSQVLILSVVIMTVYVAMHVKIITPFNKSFFTEISEEVEDGLLEECRKEYSKINEKKVKKGKEPLTQLQMVEKIKKEIKIISNPLLFSLFFGMFLFSTWLLLTYKVQLISIIAITVSSSILLLYITIFAVKKDLYKFVKLLENKEIKL
ncbi:hypothetical protein PRVXT_002435 [Proteinivorax tanatarense]|uniref:DUF1048 domain-containing protein n=1 Tax=Proteinivorax tanatarense TaxID=1260629 RepID=A0AAU7VKH8_9FIRM